MSIAHCHAKHKCAGGGEGECFSIKGHHGTHLCAACLSAFTAEAPGPAGPAGGAAPAPRAPGVQEEIPHTTEYDCAHCPHYKALSGKRCPLCGNLVCYHCNIDNCPTQFKRCAHCGVYISVRQPNKTCRWCQYEVCDKCGDWEYICPKIPQCPHCSSPFSSSYPPQTCYCNRLAHQDCMARCESAPSKERRAKVELLKTGETHRPGERAHPRGEPQAPNLQAPPRDAQPGQFQLAGVWESQVQTGYGTLVTQLILEPTKKFSQQAVLGPLLTYDVGTYQAGDGFLHFVVQDHEPKKYHGEDMHWLTSWTYFYTVVDANTMTFEDRIAGSSWTVHRRVQ